MMTKKNVWCFSSQYTKNNCVCRYTKQKHNRFNNWNSYFLQQQQTLHIPVILSRNIISNCIFNGTDTRDSPPIHHSDLGLHIRNDSFNFINWFTVPKKKNSPYSFKKISYFFFNNNLKNPSASNTKKKKKKVPVSGIIYVSRWRWWWWASLRGFHHLKHCRVHFFRFSHVFHSWFSHCFATTSNFVLCVCACVRVVMPPCVMQIAWCTPSADRAYRRLTPPAASKRRGQGQRPTHGIKKKSFIFKCFLCFSLKMWKNYISCAISPHFKRTSICVFFTSDLL